MDVKVLFCYFNIYTLYLLHPIMAAQRYCGTNLADALRIVCADRGYYTQKGAFPPVIPRQRASSFLTTDSENHHPRRLRRGTGIVTECCEKACDREVLETYCNPHVTPTLALASLVTSLMTKSPTPPSEPSSSSSSSSSSSRNEDKFPMTDNALGEDYEGPTNEGPLTSGEPTPTENRISNGPRGPSSNASSLELPTRTSTATTNSSRIVTEGAHLAESSDQSSLEDTDSESEAPTKGASHERTRKKQKKQRTRPPKKPKKLSRERKERKKKKEKERRERQRTISKKLRNEERAAGLNPTEQQEDGGGGGGGGGGGEPRNNSNSDQPRNNRGKVNESQRHPNVAQEMNPLDKITKRILASIHDIEMNREADID